MTSRTLSGVDAAWLRMDEPTNLITVTGILLLDEQIDVVRLRRLLEDRLLAQERFRMRVVVPAVGPPRWEEDRHLDIDAHVHQVGRPPPHDEGELRTDRRPALSGCV